MIGSLTLLRILCSYSNQLLKINQHSLQSPLTQIQQSSLLYKKQMNQSLRDYPEFKGFFDFQEFNPLQQQCLPKIMKTEHNMIVSAPTSSGKTVIFQMAMLKYRQFSSPMCLYLAPIKSLCHQKYTQWSRKFSKLLSVAEVTGDSLDNVNDRFLQSHIAVGTPEKIDYLSRQNLNYLKKIKLLLIDEIHMLNYQERGATLEAIVSRIMSLNNQVRIIAVSATIPNIYEVGQWLRCPPESVCIFGQEYRPVKINTVVAGYAHSGNPFTFQRILNYKLLQAIRNYSDRKGSLIFCPTQKGTQQACEQIISQMRERQFIQNDKQLMALIQAAKQVSNTKLQTMLPQGVAFHNAGLSYGDRNIVQKLFLELKIKVLCTTSTLSMGINLPARLVIIKSTQCYRGSLKGYQEYSRIEIEQMMGRAGRPPFDKEGTVVIMTQKSNYNKYNTKLHLENLESQLFNHMLQHINAEISLGSILSISDLNAYFFNSFCFIRMKQSPRTYGITGDVEEFVKNNCLKAVKALSDIGIIHYSEDTQRLSPKPLSISISKNAVEVRSISFIIAEASNIESGRQYLMTLCRCEEIGKYSSKIEERKTLKEINQKNKYSLKQAISNPERKSFVLVQAELSKHPIDYWQMRRQASDILVLLKRLNNCVKTLGFERKNFWLYYWAVRFQKYFGVKFWQHAKKETLLQFSEMQLGSKDLNRRGKALQNLQEAMQMNNWLQRDHISGGNVQLLQQCEHGIRVEVRKDESTGSISLKISSVFGFGDRFKGATVCVGDSSNHLYHYKYLNQNVTETEVFFPKGNQQEYKIAVVKDGIVGFDEFYKLKGDKLTKYDPDQVELRLSAGNRKSLEHPKNQPQLSFKEIKSNSLEPKLKPKKSKSQENHEITLKKMKNIKNHEQFSSQSIESDLEETKIFRNNHKKQCQLQLPEKYRIRQPSYEEETENKSFLNKQIQKSSAKYRDIKQYKWKPGFEEIKSSQSEKEENNRELKLVESKEKNINFSFSDYLFEEEMPRKGGSTLFEKIRNKKSQKKECKEGEAEDVFSYFYNLF